MININKPTSGQGMTEYLIIVALMAISAIAIIKTTSQNMKVGFGRVAKSLQGKDDSDLSYEEATQEKVKSRDMGDFSNGTK